MNANPGQSYQDAITNTFLGAGHAIILTSLLLVMGFERLGQQPAHHHGSLWFALGGDAGRRYLSRSSLAACPASPCGFLTTRLLLRRRGLCT